MSEIKKQETSQKKRMSKKAMIKSHGDTRPGRVEKTSGAGIVADIAIITVLVIVMLICIIPLWHVLMASLSDGRQLSSNSGMLWWWLDSEGNYGGAPNFGGYITTLKYTDFAIVKSYAITIVYVIGNVLLGLFINVVAGYVLSADTKISKPLMLFILVTMMFNGGTIPTYMVIRALGMLETPLALILPGCTGAMFVILGYNAFKTVPRSTIEAAELDGAGSFRIMFQVMLPQAIGLFIVSMINTGIMTWNSWFEAFIYTGQTEGLWPLQLWIRRLGSDLGDPNIDLHYDYNNMLVTYCVIIVSMLPILISMPFIQKQLQKGSLAGAVKE